MLEHTTFASALLTAHALSYSTPDGRKLFDALELAIQSKKCALVGSNGIGKSTLLRLLVGELEPQSGSIHRNGRIAYLPQHLVSMITVAQGESETTIAETLGISAKLDALERIASGDSSTEVFEKIGDDWDIAERATRALADYGLLNFALSHPWSRLSCGERMRVLFARLALSNPDLILLDEPSNHLDRTARTQLKELISAFKGGVLLISHDRELLRSVDEIWELSEKGLRIYGGSFDLYQEQRTIEQEAVEREIERARQSIGLREAEQRDARARQTKRMERGKKIGAAGGMPRILRGALKRKAEVTLAKSNEKNESLVADAHSFLREAREKLRDDARIQLDFDEATVPASGKTALEIRGLNFLRPDGSRLWRMPVDFALRSGSRLAVEGPNGSGKSTLLRAIAVASNKDPQETTPFESEGLIRTGVNIAYLDQTVSLLDRDESLLEFYSETASHLTESERRIRLARFLFTQEKISTRCRDLSGGERLRAGLLCLLSSRPAPDLLILDEPTNNLDLQSLGQLEVALRETRLGLIVVSHDPEFLDAIGIDDRIRLD